LERRAYKAKAGSLNNLKLVSENLSDPGPDEVTVKVHAIGLNFADIFALQGLYSATPKGLFIPGLEFSGEIMKKGKHITGSEPGTKVMGVTKFGAYTDLLNKWSP